MSALKLFVFFYRLEMCLKMYHFQTPSYARHIASGSLEDDVHDTLDKFLEIYQGKYGKMTNSSEFSIPVTSFSATQIVAFLKEAKMFLESLVEARILDESDTDLLNIRDDLVGKINQTLYLFTFQ
jgi:hypothetical protein